MIRQRPIRGESHLDFLGESEGSLPPPQDSLPDAGEAMNDFWSMSGNFIYRHHVEPRVKLYSPREESFPIPLKYIDVSRTTHTNLDVKQEKRIDDYWNIDGSRDLSDYWTGFTRQGLEKFCVSSTTIVIKTELWTEVHSPVVRAADCRSACPWFNSGWRHWIHTHWHIQRNNMMSPITNTMTMPITTIPRKSVNKNSAGNLGRLTFLT